MAFPPSQRRVLITGAAGRLGTQLRRGLRDMPLTIRLTDRREIPQRDALEEVVVADLTDMAAVCAAMQDVDLVVHLGAVMPLQPWEQVLPANVVGTYNVFEAARQAGVRRIVFASSHHAVGMYPRTAILDADTAPRPDTLYGVSKAFGEALARMYHDKHGIEFACLRIGSCFEAPTDERMLATWLSHGDFVQLCRRCIEAAHVGFSVIYGMSANTRRWWSNDKVAFLGYVPRDNAEAHAADLPPPCPALRADSPELALQGGRYVVAQAASHNGSPL